jgi:hypothetical protein
MERAVRDEGTSYHYLSPFAYAEAVPALLGLAARAFASAGQAVHRGATWMRHSAKPPARSRIAALYACAAARARPIICLAHVSNQLGCRKGDFEKARTTGQAPRSISSRHWRGCG